MIEEEYFYSQEFDEDGTLISYLEAYRGNDGMAVARALMPDNTLVEEPRVDGDGEAISYDLNYANPYRDLTSENLIIAEDSLTITNLNDDLAHRFAITTAGYDDLPFESLTLNFDETKTITGGEYLGIVKEVPLNYEGEDILLDVLLTYDFEFVDVETLDYVKAEVLLETESQKRLDNLFLKS